MFVDIYNTENKYHIIYADPPWRYDNKHAKGEADSLYPTLALEEIKNIPVGKLAEKDCVLFLWFTYPMIQEALEVIKSWGFEYKTLGFQWVKLSTTGQKLHWGPGYWTRRNSEGCFIATKGNIRPVRHDIHELVISPLIKHSKKPDSCREDIVKLMGPLSRIELFSRQGYNGWDFWGNEVGEAGNYIPIKIKPKETKLF